MSHASEEKPANFFFPYLFHSFSLLVFRLRVSAPCERVGDGSLCVDEGHIPWKAFPGGKTQTRRKEHSRIGFMTCFSLNLFKPKSFEDKHSIPAHHIFRIGGGFRG